MRETDTWLRIMMPELLIQITLRRRHSIVFEFLTYFWIPYTLLKENVIVPQNLASTLISMQFSLNLSNHHTYYANH